MVDRLRGRCCQYSAKAEIRSEKEEGSSFEVVVLWNWSGSVFGSGIRWLWLLLSASADVKFGHHNAD